MGFAENLRQLRKSKDWTQIELGEKCGINPKTLSSYEQGRTEPNLGEVVKLCSVFNCSIASLTGTKEREPNNITVDEILFRLNSLDDETLRKLENAAIQIRNRREEKKMMEQERAMLRKQISDYELRIKQLTEQLGGDDQ